MDKGNAVLVPSYRPVGFQQVLVGDRFRDPNWVGLNVNTNTYLPVAIDKIAGLTYLAVAGAKLSPNFTPNVKEYTVALPRGSRSLQITVHPTSTRSRQLTINEESAQAGVPHEVKLKGTPPSIHIRVLSPDGTGMAQYTVTGR
jgi:hypothetical protein